MQQSETNLQVTLQQSQPDHVQINSDCKFPCPLFVRQANGSFYMATVVCLNILSIWYEIIDEKIAVTLFFSALYVNFRMSFKNNKLMALYSDNSKKVEDLYKYYNQLRDSNEIKVSDFRIIKCTLNRNGPLRQRLKEFEVIFVDFFPQLIFGNQKSKEQFEKIFGQMDQTNLQICSTQSPFPWKNRQTFLNMTEKKRKFMIFLYLVASTFCISWILQWYVNCKLSVECKIVIKKEFDDGVDHLQNDIV